MSNALCVTAFWCPNDCLQLRFVSARGLDKYLRKRLTTRLMKKGYAVLFIPATKYVPGAADGSRCAQREFTSVYACKSLKGCTSINIETLMEDIIGAKHVGAVLTDMSDEAYAHVAETWFGPYDQNKGIIENCRPLRSKWDLWFDSGRIRHGWGTESNPWKGRMCMMAPKAGGEQPLKKRKKRK